MDLRVILLLSITLLVPVCASAQIGGSTSPDPRVRNALEQEERQYEVTEDGDFKLVPEFEEGRSQIVWVESSTNEVMGLEVREIFTIVYAQEEDRPVSDKIAQWALQKSSELNVGSLASTGDGVVYYTLKIDASASPSTLSNAIDGAAIVGDELEKNKSTGDEW